MYSHQASSTEDGERDTAVRRGRQTHVREYIGGKNKWCQPLIKQKKTEKV